MQLGEATACPACSEAHTYGIGRHDGRVVIPSVCVPEGKVCGVMDCRAISYDEMSGLACLQEHLLALHKKLEFAKSSEAAAKSAAMQDIAPELERLRAKAVTKSRDILMNRHASAHC